MKISILLFTICLSAQASVSCINDYLKRKDELVKHLPYSFPIVAIPLLKTVKLIKILSGAEVLGIGDQTYKQAKDLKKIGKDIIYAGRFIGGSLGSELKSLGKDIQEFSQDVMDITSKIHDTQIISEVGREIILIASKLNKFSERVKEIGDRLNISDLERLGKDGIKLAKRINLLGSDIIYLSEQLNNFEDLKEFTDYVNKRETSVSFTFISLGKKIFSLKDKICDSSLVSKYKKRRFVKTKKLKFRLSSKKELLNSI